MRYPRVMRRLQAAVLSATALLVGCGTYQTRPVVLRSYPGATAAHGVVCVVRSGDDADEADRTVPVWDNGVLVGATQGASHFCYLAEAGRHLVVSELLLTADLRIDVRPDEHHWVAQEVGISSYRYAGRRRGEWVALREVSAAEARASFTRTKRLELVDVPVGEAVPVGGAVLALRATR
jgi:hypothetical protein